MRYVYVADDFTGASDTLATLSRAGCRSRLFADLPPVGSLKGLDAWGIATHARALDRAGVMALAARLGTGLAPHFTDGGVLHVKVCSTFDSALEVGNIALLAQGLAGEIGAHRIAVVGGQPSLGRYAIFGTLFARGPDGAIHRIDRHPVMAQHPVTPMHEADLVRHLADLGLAGLRLVPRGESGAGVPWPRFYDVLEADDLIAVGLDLHREVSQGGPLVVIGASSVAEAWTTSMPLQATSRPPIGPCASAWRGPVLAFVGSRSALTAAQVEQAQGFLRLPVAPADLVGDTAEASRVLAAVRQGLDADENCLVWVTPASLPAGQTPAMLADAGARFVTRVLAQVSPGALVIVGGDTSSAVVRAIAPRYLDHAGDLGPGVPILTARGEDGDLPMILKGGQMGEATFFTRIAGLPTAERYVAEST